MLTDIRPIVERLMRQLVLAGLPAVAAACGDTHAGVCEPLSIKCGTPMICSSPTGTSGPVSSTTATIPFDPGDGRWAGLYRACLSSDAMAACTADCDAFCSAVVEAAGNGRAATSRYHTCDVSCGPPHQVTAVFEQSVCGRRCTRSVRRERRPTRDPLGQYLAHAAELEAESVPAFARLARGLAAHDAPAELVRAARAATTEEARHWKWTRALARRHDARPVKPTVQRTDFASLQALAEDNVVEGCVRETYGALVAAYQAESAADADVRRLMSAIAVDELGHAALSWKIDAWAGKRLGPHLGARRAQVAETAVAELIGATQHSVADRVRVQAGLPSPETARALLATACTVVWAPNLGS